MKKERYGLFRPQPLPSKNIPLGARSVGNYTVSPGWKDLSFRKSFVQIFWGVEGKGQITIDRIAHELTPGTVAIYMPGMMHDVSALNEDWSFRWWTMDGEQAVEIVEGFGLKSGVFSAGPAPVELFNQLEEVIVNPTAKSEIDSSALAYRLLCAVAGSISCPDDFSSGSATIKKAVQFCRRYWSQPEFNVEFLAGKLEIHRTTLSRLFSKHTGTTLNKYITRMRLQNAQSLLQQTDLSIAEISRQCGFDDPNYFSRLFSKHLQISPTDFRKSQL